MAEQYNNNQSVWSDIITGLKYGQGKLDHDEVDESDYLIKQLEIALKHPDTESIVKLTDDGMIDIFASPQLGIRLDPNTQSINFFGDSVNLFASKFNLRTKQNGFSWNGKSFSPPTTESTTKIRYSEGMLDILKDLGLPVDKETV